MAETQIPATQLFTVKTSPLAKNSFSSYHNIPEQAWALILEGNQQHSLQTCLYWSKSIVKMFFTVDNAMDKTINWPVVPGYEQKS